MLESYTQQYLHPLLSRPNFPYDLQAASLTYHMLEGYTLQYLHPLFTRPNFPCNLQGASLTYHMLEAVLRIRIRDPG
jgi:hypothetical protein